MLKLYTYICIFSSLIAIPALPVTDESRGLSVKGTYMLPPSTPGYKEFPPRYDGCNMIIQGPNDDVTDTTAQWEYVKQCKYAFPYCNMGQKPAQLDGVQLVDKVTPAWGGSDLYVVEYQNFHALTEAEAVADKLRGAGGVSMFKIDKNGVKHSFGFDSTGFKWAAAEVKCPNPFKYAVGEQGRFIYNI